MKIRRTFAALIFLLAACFSTGAGQIAHETFAQSQGGVRSFPETNHTVKGRFLDYWEQHGGVAQQGYPLTEEMDETSATNGKTYTVQYFERAVFEKHTENSEPYDVLLSLLGTFEYNNRYGKAGAPGQKASTTNPVVFRETGKTLGGKFRAYWEAHGGLAQQGFPISNEFQEKNTLDGKLYTVQYFERAVFELHPENAGTPYEVLLSQLGSFRFKNTYIYPGVTVPILPERIRFKLAASDRYIVWEEATYPASGGITEGTGDILGYDTETNKPIDVSRNEPNDQSSPAISGSIVAYQSQPNALHIGQDDIVTKDLATGATYKLLDSFATPNSTAGRYPSVSGRRVAWIEFDATGSRVMIRDLDSNTPTIIATLPPNDNSSFSQVQISAEYVVWTELAYTGRNDPPRASSLKAHNLKTGETKTLFQFVTPNGSGEAEFSLDGHNLAVSGSEYGFKDGQIVDGAKPQVIDLDSGASTQIDWTRPDHQPMESPVLKGDILVWSSSTQKNAVDNHGLDIWGLDLKGGKPVPLVIGAGVDHVSPVIVGDKLAWLDQQGPNDGGIGIISLSAAFATAPEREQALQK